MHDFIRRNLVGNPGGVEKKFEKEKGQNQQAEQKDRIVCNRQVYNRPRQGRPIGHGFAIRGWRHGQLITVRRFYYHSLEQVFQGVKHFRPGKAMIINSSRR